MIITGKLLPKRAAFFFDLSLDYTNYIQKCSLSVILAIYQISFLVFLRYGKLT
ncbi:hypothetical protein CCP3SC1_1160003 [Gammaproteobacteria bacterium]